MIVIINWWLDDWGLFDGLFNDCLIFKRKLDGYESGYYYYVIYVLSIN